MKQVGKLIRHFFVISAWSVLSIIIPFYAVSFAQQGSAPVPPGVAGGGTVMPGGDTITEPNVQLGVTIVPLEQQSVPDVLKTQARIEIKQMKERGYVDASTESVSYLDKAQNNQDTRLQAMGNVAPILKIVPANIELSAFAKTSATLLGATAHGGFTEEGWTGLTRIFVLPDFEGVVELNEVDYVASGGGIALIEEAINQDVNGAPAIFRVQKSQHNKGLTSLTWATEVKIYTLSTNRALLSKKAIEKFMNLARNVI